MFLLWCTCVTCALAAETPARFRTPAELKELTLEELIDQEVQLVSREPQRISQVPSAIVVVSQEDIRRSGATSLPEALRLAPNLQVAQVNSRDWAISSRGFQSALANKLLVMIDGRTVYTPLFAGVFWDVQDTLLEDIDHIEVISGPAGALWGANAVNGLINVVTKSAKATQGGLLLGGVGSELNGFGGLRYGGKLGKDVYYRVYGKYQDRDSTEFSGNGRQATNGWAMGQGGLRLDWEAPGENFLTFQGDGYDGSTDRPQNSDTSVRGGNFLARWNHAFSEDSSLRVQTYYDRTYRRIPQTFRQNLDTFDIDAQHSFELGSRNRLVWGLGYRVTWDDVENSPTIAFLPAKINRQVYSIFAQDRIAIVEDRLDLTIGSRFDHNDYTGFEIQPNIRMAWTPSRTHTVWGAVSRAVRTPSRFDEHLFLPGDGPPFGLVQGGSGFESEELVAYELGYRVQPAAKLGLSITGFYHDYDNLRSLEPVAPPVRFPLVVANGLHGETYGAEVAANYQATDWWRLRFGYTELQVHIRARPGSLDTSRGGAESQDANHHFSLWSMWNLPAGFMLDAGFRYVSRIANQHVPAYGEMDARLAWQPKSNLELSIVGQNLLNSQHPEFGPAGSRFEIERSVYGKVTWQF